MGKVDAFRMLVDAPATLERVAAAASFIDRLIKAAHPGLAEGAITVVVNNLNMGTAVRSWTPEGVHVHEEAAVIA
jgi:hypothetical protein